MQKKLKLLHILDILKKTDEQHPVTASKIISKLDEMGIEAERKSVLRDISLLKEEYGCGIELSEDNKRGFYMYEREFEDWEIKLLCDAAAGAKFLTEKDRRELIKKLCGLSSEEGGKQIRNMTFIRGTGAQKQTTKNNIDLVMRAIAAGKKITFQYADIEKPFKRNGLVYKLSPYAVALIDNVYHVSGCFEGKAGISHYRLDCLRNTEILDEKAYPLNEIYSDSPQEKLKEYIENKIYNYSGNPIWITLKAKGYMLPAIQEQFGENIRLRECGEYYEVDVQTVDSNGLYYWLLKYGCMITVIAPEAVRKKMKTQFVDRVYRNYR